MSSKESVAISQLLGLLESRYAMRVLWALRDGHAQTFRLLQDSVGGITPNTLNTRIKELREAGLMTHGSDGYSVTSIGADLLKRMGDLQAFAGKWSLAQTKRPSSRIHGPIGSSSKKTGYPCLFFACGIINSLIQKPAHTSCMALIPRN